MNLRKISALLMVIVFAASISNAAVVSYWQKSQSGWAGQDSVGTHNLTEYTDGTVSNVWYSPNSPDSELHDSTFDLDPTKSFTAEGYFSSKSATGIIVGARHSDAGNPLAGQYGGSYRGWAVYSSGNGGLVNFYADGDAAGASVTLTNSITKQQEYHFAAVFDAAAGEMRLYLDGSLVQSSAVPETWSHHRGGALGIGARNAGAGFNDWVQNGTIGDIRISDEALAPSQFLPEPATMLLLGCGALVIRKRK
jgi:hypothetical protein